MKKLFAFLIMLMVGMALFAMPVIGESDTVSSENTIETAQFVGVFATVADVSLVITLAENPFINYFEVTTLAENPFINYFEVTAINDNLYSSPKNEICLYRLEVYLIRVALKRRYLKTD